MTSSHLVKVLISALVNFFIPQTASLNIRNSSCTIRYFCKILFEIGMWRNIIILYYIILYYIILYYIILYYIILYYITFNKIPFSGSRVIPNIDRTDRRTCMTKFTVASCKRFVDGLKNNQICSMHSEEE